MTDIAVIYDVCATSGGGTQDFTTATSIGTPLGAIFIVGRGAADGTAVAHTQMSIGFTDGTRSRCLVTTAEDFGGASNSDGYCRGDSANVMVTTNPTTGTLDGNATHNSFINNGIRVNWADYPPTAYKVTVILFGGNVTGCYVNSVSNLGGLNTTYTINTVPFQSDVIFQLSQDGSSFGGATNNRTSLNFGFCVRDGASPPGQYNAGFYSQDNVATTNCNEVWNNNSAGGIVNSGAGDELEFSNIVSAGFDYTCRVSNSAGGVDFAYLCVAGLTGKVVSYTTPTTATTKDITGAGATPQFGLGLLTAGTAASQSDNTPPGAEYFGIAAFDASVQSCTAVWTADGVTTPDAVSIADSKAVHLKSSSADFNVATFTGFNSDGGTLSFSTANGTARQAAFLLVQAPAAGPSPGADSGAVGASEAVQPLQVGVLATEAG